MVIVAIPGIDLGLARPGGGSGGFPLVEITYARKSMSRHNGAAQFIVHGGDGSGDRPKGSVGMEDAAIVRRQQVIRDHIELAG